MMIWEIETDDLPAVFERVNRGLKSGTTVLVGAIDGTANSNTFTPDQARNRQPDPRDVTGAGAGACDGTRAVKLRTAGREKRGKRQ